jgi:hypothetical protein
LANQILTEKFVLIVQGAANNCQIAIGLIGPITTATGGVIELIRPITAFRLLNRRKIIRLLGRRIYVQMIMNWTESETFKGIDLNDSFVLSWSQEGGSLSIDLEACIWPESKYYSKPKKDEYTCYKKAVLSFVGVESIEGLKPIDSVSLTSTDLDGTIDYGNIDSLLKTSSGFEVEGDFGSVVITGGELKFEVHT